jgi:hypothetical protein
MSDPVWMDLRSALENGSRWYICINIDIYLIHTYMHTWIRTYIHTYLHTYIPTYLHTYIPTVHTYTSASCIHIS